jgi:regulator of RNase E activity RraA
MTPASINAPIRIGEVTVFPGDVVLANKYGVVFIPSTGRRIGFFLRNGGPAR